MSIEQSKHTPAPWAVMEAEDARYITASDGNQYIAKTLDLLDEPANARLMAAAPDLLAALAGMLVSDNDRHRESDDRWTLFRRDAHAAIAKATGGAS